MTLFGVLSLLDTTEILEKQYKSEAEFILTKTTENFEQEFSNVESVLQQLSGSPVIRNITISDKDKIDKLLQFYEELSLTQGMLHYITESGELYNNHHAGTQEIVKAEWYAEAIRHPQQIIWIDPYIDDYTNNVVITALKAVYNQGEPQGVLFIHFSLTEMSKQIHNTKVGNNGLFLLLNNEGTIVVHEDFEMIGTFLFGSSSFADMLQKTNNDFVSYDIQEKRYLVRSNTIKQNDLNIVVAVSKLEIFKAILKSHLPIVITGVFSLLLFSVVTYIAILRWVRPLDTLGGLMGSVENGDYNVQAEINDYKEVSRLAAGFNSMILSIKKRDEELLVSNAELKLIEGRLRGKYEQLKESEEKVLQLAAYDSLTGLLNRRSLYETLTTALATSDGQLKAIIFIDLDDFKMINDTLGHTIGDKLLIELSNKFKSLPYVHKDVARISGDEFIIVVHDIQSVEEIQDFAQQIICLFEAPISIESKQLHVTASVGIAVYPIHAQNYEELLKIADMAMYRAKENGKNSYQIYDESIRQEVEEKLRIEQGIRESLEMNQFELFYQPLFSPKENRIVSVEALLRTNSPILANYNIMQIIKQAEISGQIVDIDRWVLKEACHTIQKINQHFDKPVRISINVSAIHIMQQDFVATVKESIESSGVPMEWIKLEITETSLMESFNLNIKKLRKLQEIGISFSLDDFGTGYSSLNYLKTLPIDYVKIDKSFIKMMLQSEKDSKIVETIIHLAHNIGLKVVAEGVENQEQFDTLQDYQCELLQGYYISRPINYTDILVKITETNMDELSQ